MKNLFATFLLSALLTFSANEVSAKDYGDKDCNIFVTHAGNVITGGYGSYLSATVAVTKTLINEHFKNYEVRIVGAENVAPSSVIDAGRLVIFSFDHFTRGIEYHRNSAAVTAFISNGVDRLFDNNDNVQLTGRFNWQYTQPRCR